MSPSGMLRRVALVRTDVSEERITSIIRVTRIGELGTTLAVTSNRSTLRRNNVLNSAIVVTLMMEAGLCSGNLVFPVRYELGFYIPEDGVLHCHCRKNFKSYFVLNYLSTGTSLHFYFLVDSIYIAYYCIVVPIPYFLKLFIRCCEISLNN
jgi:hypothetical protein